MAWREQLESEMKDLTPNQLEQLWWFVFGLWLSEKMKYYSFELINHK